MRKQSFKRTLEFTPMLVTALALVLMFTVASQMETFNPSPTGKAVIDLQKTYNQQGNSTLQKIKENPMAEYNIMPWKKNLRLK